jgi:hypothetical protein
MKLSEAFGMVARENRSIRGLVRKMNGAAVFGHRESVELLEAARGLSCAAQEIERRMAGVPAPKSGE